MIGLPAGNAHPEIRARLAWCYGPERTRRIIEGRDWRANADLNAWRRVCNLSDGRPLSWERLAVDVAILALQDMAQ